MKFRRFKPGSMLADGCVIDHQGEVSQRGPCFIPGDLSQERRMLLDAAGWRITPAINWPRVRPYQGAICIDRQKG